MDVSVLLAADAAIGESPTWVAAEEAVYWIDVKAPALHRLILSSGMVRTWRLPADIGAFALTRNRADAIVALRSGLFRLGLRTSDLAPLAPPPFDPCLHRFNEGACDSHGRFWLGTMFDPIGPTQAPPEPAALHSFTLGDGLHPQPDAAELHNGMAWSPDETIFYLAHSRRRTVFAFPFDVGNGRLGTPRRFVTTPPALGVPDGAAVDAEGGYWCALHGGWCLHRYGPDGRLDRTVRLPVSQPTMCAFAGRDLDLLIVTTATDKLSTDQRAREPHAGSLLCLRTATPGIARHCTVA